MPGLNKDTSRPAYTTEKSLTLHRSQISVGRVTIKSYIKRVCYR